MRKLRTLRRLLVPAASAGALLLVARGELALDTGIGRRMRPLGPITVPIAAPVEVVFDVVAEPYLHRTPKAMDGKLRVLERGSDLVVAAHFTRTRWFTTTTVESVGFDRPNQVSFSLLRGPVPHVAETFTLHAATDDGTTLEYAGELGTDFWTVGEMWGNVVARRWESTVRASLLSITEEAERRARRHR